MSGDESLLKGKRILAVDDEEDILETIEDILDDTAYYPGLSAFYNVR